MREQIERYLKECSANVLLIKKRLQNIYIELSNCDEPLESLSNMYDHLSDKFNKDFQQFQTEIIIHYAGHANSNDYMKQLTQDFNMMRYDQLLTIAAQIKWWEKQKLYFQAQMTKLEESLKQTKKDIASAYKYLSLNNCHLFSSPQGPITPKSPTSMSPR